MATKKKIIKKKPQQKDYKKAYDSLWSSFKTTTDMLSQYETERNFLKKQIEEQTIMFSERLGTIRAETSNMIEPDKYNSLRSSLVGCLSKLEINAAEVTGCAPELYAIELLKLFQEWKKKPKDTEDISQKLGYR